MTAQITPDEVVNLQRMMWDAAYTVTFTTAVPIPGRTPQETLQWWGDWRWELIRLHKDACQAAAGNPPYYLRPSR